MNWSITGISNKGIPVYSLVFLEGFRYSVTMLSKKTAILEKVQKLLALGESPNEAEAASALEKAQLLLAKHGLAMADLEEAREPLSEKILLEKKRLRKWESYLIAVVARATFTDPLHFRSKSEGRVFLVGREVNTAAAGELFSYLHLSILRLSRKHRSKIEHLDSYRIGVVLRIEERLREGNDLEGPSDGASAEPSSKALVLDMQAVSSRENRDYIQDKYGRTSRKKVNTRVEPGSYSLGREHGSGISLNKQVE